MSDITVTQMEHAAQAEPGILKQVQHHHDYSGTKLGMWLFLFTELLLFGGLFICYAVFRHGYAHDFHNAAKELNVLMGTINTSVLLTSSLTMAMSITAMQKGKRGLAIGLVGVTIVCGLIFMVIKYFEWSAKISHGIYPGSPEIMQLHNGEVMFFWLYYVMTGLHGLHVLVGMVLLGIVALLLRKKPMDVRSFKLAADHSVTGAEVSLRERSGTDLWSSKLDNDVERVDVVLHYRPAQHTVRPRDYVYLENAGLWWHLVDIVWIFLFPLFYLIT